MGTLPNLYNTHTHTHAYTCVKRALHATWHDLAIEPAQAEKVIPARHKRKRTLDNLPSFTQHLVRLHPLLAPGHARFPHVHMQQAGMHVFVMLST
jgi:hypothetical protein